LKITNITNYFATVTKLNFLK